MDAGTWIAGASFFVAACAFWLSWRSDIRGRAAARSQLYLELRTRFLKILEDLPPEYQKPDWTASDPKHREAAIRYWQHAFDEWYLTTQLHEKLMRPLWDKFFRRMVRAGLGHSGLRKTLIEMMKDAELLKGWRGFFQELERIWAEDHPRDGSKCLGIQCDH
jgi:hypothetical protein